MSQELSTLIGINKYNYLKSLKPEELTEIEKKQIEAFENKNKGLSESAILAEKKYFERIRSEKEIKSIKPTLKSVWERFKEVFKEEQGKYFKETPQTIENIKPILYYFLQDEKFFNCKNLLKEKSVPSFEKGLLIVGDFGNGKSSIMETFCLVFKGKKGYGFRSYSTNEIVTMFEQCTGENGDSKRQEFEKIMYNFKAYFDDMKTERIASNYGKVNIIKEILEERYNRKVITFATCNYKEGYEGDIDEAIKEFGEKYGGRVYDRIFEMFNIIHFKGGSFRK